MFLSSFPRSHMASMLAEKQRNLTPVNAQTQAQQTVVWSKPSVQLPKVLKGVERFDGAPLKFKHAVASSGQRRLLISMECDSSHAPRVNILSPFATAEDNIARLAQGTRKVIVNPIPQDVQAHDAEMVPWNELFQADNDMLHASSYAPKFDDMVCNCTLPLRHVFC
jgi:hypothetical protein